MTREYRIFMINKSVGNELNKNVEKTIEIFQYYQLSLMSVIKINPLVSIRDILSLDIKVKKISLFSY